MFTKTKILIIAIFFVIFGVLITSTINIPGNLEPRESQFDALEYPADINASINGCGATFVFDTSSMWYGTIPEGYTAEIPQGPMNLPAYGYMSTTPFDKSKIGVYPKEFEGFAIPEIYRALWDGVTIVWYKPSISDDNYKAMELVVLNKIQNGEEILLLPFTLPEKVIPLNRNFATSAWGTTQSCGIFDEKVFDEFLLFKDTVYNERDIENPPVAVLNSNGELRKITP
jgi:hypothetical protein